MIHIQQKMLQNVRYEDANLSKVMDAVLLPDSYWSVANDYQEP